MRLFLLAGVLLATCLLAASCATTRDPMQLQSDEFTLVEIRNERRYSAYHRNWYDMVALIWERADGFRVQTEGTLGRPYQRGTRAVITYKK